MAAIGFGLVMFGYGCLYYGMALITGQHRPFLYAMFHRGTAPDTGGQPMAQAPGAGTNQTSSSGTGGSGNFQP